MGRTMHLDDDVAAQLKAEAARAQKTVDEVGNHIIREKLERKRFRIEGPFVRSVIEITNVEQVLDDIEGPLRK
jgi:hypothetical protein